MTLSQSCVAADRIMLGFACILAILAMFFGGDAGLPERIAPIVVALAALLLPILGRRSKRLPGQLLYLLYVLPSLYLIYPIAIALGHHLHAHDFDSTLISVDRFLFGGIDPTRWIYQHLSLAPLTVEVLQVCYYAHYLYPLALGTEFILGKREAELEHFRLIMVYGSIVSFVGNMLVPAIGPRFTLHEFANLSKELPGVWLTDSLRGMLNTAEGIKATMTSSVAALTVFRDAFPSGHVMLTLLNLWTAFHYRARVRWFLLPLGSGLIVSTILLRYHYVTDVIAAGLLAALTIWTAPMLARLVGRTNHLRVRRANQIAAT
ncbi:MAG: phosphatase PAP2 family protein [Bacteroidota bacterium]|nr:phosphatase PAP2 family protein [Bacteroidota bacterium]MDP4233814.1 phosphatase PAP2 family protein [Bacteroidota bacterium]MDP4242487.1 phosphatase PAP2 family protein [Bacteroidota bacterium]MDP4289035.1 phosphatase PAP2 family protein [Bacteroidota bacterium]